MLKTLRKKFIFTNMILVGIMLIIIFIIICTNIYAIQKEEVERTLHAPFAGGTRYESEMGVLTSIVVIVDKDGNFAETYLNGAVLDRDTLKEVVNEVMEDDDNKGKIRKENLYYEKSKVLDSPMTAIVFVDSHRLEDAMARTIFVSFLAFILAMVIVYFISRFIARIAIEPVQKSWDQQKRFIADASHELKTPLTVILANSEILKQRSYSTISEQEQWINSTVDEAQHMKALVEDMLFLAKNDSGTIVDEMALLDFSQLVSGDILQFEPVAYEKGVFLQEEIKEDIQINGNETRLRQLMHILLDNAIKYAEGEDKLVSVNLTNKGMAAITLTVSNTGAIIPPDNIGHLFDRFYRSDAARTKQGNKGGYGLGLAIAKAIVENHGGNISVESGMDCGANKMPGTTFKITFNK